MSWKGDSKQFDGPDEDSKYYQKHESKKTARLVAQADHGFNRESKETSERLTRYNVLCDKVRNRMHTEAFNTLQEVTKPFQSPSVELKFKRGNNRTSPYFTYEINNDKVLANNKLGCSVELSLKSDCSLEADFVGSDTSLLIRVWRFDDLQWDVDKRIRDDSHENQWESLLEDALRANVYRGEYEFYMLKIEKSFATIDRVALNEGERLANQFWRNK